MPLSELLCLEKYSNNHMEDRGEMKQNRQDKLKINTKVIDTNKNISRKIVTTLN